MIIKLKIMQKINL